MLLDNSGLLCSFYRNETQHTESVRLIKAAPLLLTHNLILAELVAIAQARGLPRRPLLDFLADLMDDPAVVVVFVDRDLHRSAVDLLRRRPDKAWSLCDAVSFVLMAERGPSEALTTDRHFEQAGFSRLLRP